MKRFLILLALGLSGLLARTAHASIFDVWQSSYTQSVDVYKVLSSSPAVLNQVCIDSAGVTLSNQSAQVAIYNASQSVNVAVSTIAVIDASAVGAKQCYNFNTFVSSGIVYTNSGGTAPKTTILWNTYNR